MALIDPVRFRVDDPSGVAPALRAGEQMAERLGFDERRRGEIAIVVTELATNLLRHAEGGVLTLRVTGGERRQADDGGGEHEGISGHGFVPPFPRSAFRAARNHDD